MYCTVSRDLLQGLLDLTPPQGLPVSPLTPKVAVKCSHSGRLARNGLSAVISPGHVQAPWERPVAIETPKG